MKGWPDHTHNPAIRPASGMLEPTGRDWGGWRKVLQWPLEQVGGRGEAAMQLQGHK